MEVEANFSVFGITPPEIPSKFFSGFEYVELPNKDRLLKFPTCTVPNSFLDRSAWERVTQMGNVRSVYSIDRLVDGTKPRLVAKCPERFFTKDEKQLALGHVWWGGPKSLEKRTYLGGNPVVESQSLWEGIYLLQLRFKSFRAEIPQAIINTPDNKNILVVGEITTSMNGISPREEEPKLSDITGKTGLTPAEDWKGHNLIKDGLGKIWIIDVNRWSWSPYTDGYRKKLLDLLIK